MGSQCQYSGEGGGALRERPRDRLPLRTRWAGGGGQLQHPGARGTGEWAGNAWVSAVGPLGDPTSVETQGISGGPRRGWVPGSHSPPQHCRPFCASPPHPPISPQLRAGAPLAALGASMASACVIPPAPVAGRGRQSPRLGVWGRARLPCDFRCADTLDPGSLSAPHGWWGLRWTSVGRDLLTVGAEGHAGLCPTVLGGPGKHQGGTRRPVTPALGEGLLAQCEGPATMCDPHGCLEPQFPHL